MKEEGKRKKELTVKTCTADVRILGDSKTKEQRNSKNADRAKLGYTTAKETRERRIAFVVHCFRVCQSSYIVLLEMKTTGITAPGADQQQPRP